LDIIYYQKIKGGGLMACAGGKGGAGKGGSGKKPKGK